MPETIREFIPEPAGNVVVVSVPVETYFNLEKMQKFQRDLFARLGHQGCHSGYDIRFDMRRRIILDANAKIKETVIAS